jgi:hypothetical protein
MGCIMSSDNEYRPRMTVELTSTQYYQLNKILPHGMKKPLFQALVNGVIEAHKRGGMEAIAAIIGRHIDTVQLAQLGQKGKE